MPADQRIECREFGFGMKVMTDGLKVAADSALRSILAGWTSTVPRGIAAGILDDVTSMPSAADSGNDLNIHSTDTDGDGYSDAEEIQAGSNPLNIDSIPVTADGDANLDGRLDVADILLVQRHVLGIAPLASGRITHADLYPPGGGDGVITVQDLLLVTRVVMAQ